MTKTKWRIAAENVTRIMGEPTAEDVDKLEIECAEISQWSLRLVSSRVEMNWGTCA